MEGIRPLSAFLFNSPSCNLYPAFPIRSGHFALRNPRFTHQTQTKLRFSPVIVSLDADRKYDVVIVGAGIAGLGTALCLHRLGVQSLVLEQAGSLRTGGTSLTLFKNGWRVLDIMGVGEELRKQYLEIQGMVIKSEKGKELRSFTFEAEAKGQEVRAVERRILLETLANELPQNTIRFSSGVSTIKKTRSGETLLVLDDDSRILAKVVVGCDGIRSPIAKWMGFSEPRYVGHCAYRGLGFYPEGQPFTARVNYVYGRGMRAAYVPVSPTKVYWFICYNHESPGPKINDPSQLREEAQKLVRGWPPELLNVIERTPDEAFIKSTLVDRWLWPIFSPSGSDGVVVLAGDAWHPMTPNLGQGACCALEDAVVLSKKIAAALNTDHSNLRYALESYTRERWGRIFPLAIRSYLVGSLLQWENPIVCAIRDNIIIPKLVKLGPLLEHTNFNCEPLR